MHFQVPVGHFNSYFEVFHSVHSHMIKHPLNVPTKCTMFIHYITYIYCISRTCFGVTFTITIHYITYIYCISPTCFGVTFTITREYLCALYLKSDIAKKQLTVFSISVAS
jgi:hypothetical protein